MISIIIPVLNEAATIRRLLSHLEANSSSSLLTEIILVDGGSTDDTKSEVWKYRHQSPNTNLKWITSHRGRAIQMNAGASLASGDILYFLHADSFPPKGFDQIICDKLNQGHAAGCFRMKFDTGHGLLRFSQWFTRFNVKLCRGGDQSLYVKNEVFRHLKGYNENYRVYEDCEFINRLYDQVGFVVMNDYIVTSARKYDLNGTWKLQFHFAMIHLKKWLGASPGELNRYYQKYIIS